MYRSFGIIGLSAALFVAAASCFTHAIFRAVSGRIDGLQVGDTLRFERVLLPEWNYEPAFDVVVGGGGCVRLSGRAGARRLLLDDLSSEKRQGRRCESSGQVDDRDRRRPDHADRYGGGDLLLYSRRRYLRRSRAFRTVVRRGFARSDSGGYSENARSAFARGDQAEGRRWNELFNRFYADDRDARKRALNEVIGKGHPQATYCSSTRFPRWPTGRWPESRAFYESLSEELKSSYFGGVYADFLRQMEPRRRAAGTPISRS